MHPVVDFDKHQDKLLKLDFTSNNTELDAAIVSDTKVFSSWIHNKLASVGCRYGIGGYNEHRTIYQRSEHFDTGSEPRRLHLGTDIWGPAGTSIYNFEEGTVHSFSFNDRFGDYGATIILQYQLGPENFYVLYGHLSLASITGLKEGMTIGKGVCFAEFGNAEENGHWPPHLHFQVIKDMQGLKGDYPGVCKYSERDVYLDNCPDPQFILSNTFGSAAF
jgi:peptidoglycan LD-endopeptidase LytH